MPDDEQRPSPRHAPEPTVAPRDVAGRGAEETADLYRADGFHVQVLDVATSRYMTLEYRPDRIRLLVRDGLVVRALRG